ncbi:hypothetical protein [Pantoea ananatis]|uniref:hypothetical protein n=1 Tax=Pantoea ananas TaxID=553 RepID=UPI001FF0BAE9|nr:hypothetical protein [Pantoea ananatis]
MNKLGATALMAFMFSAACLAAPKPIMQCGPFLISSSNDGFAHVNNVRPVSQKFTFLGAKEDYSSVQYQWMVPRSDYPGYYGMDYIKRNGKAILNVEAIRSNMNEPRMFGTYDCKKIS